MSKTARIRYRIATKLWPDLLLERDPRVEEMVRVAFWAGQVARAGEPAASPRRAR
jgi:hypothetical protein